MSAFLELVILPPIVPLLAVLAVSRIEEKLDREPARETSAAPMAPQTAPVPPVRDPSV